jgi:hypothetical protein
MCKIIDFLRYKFLYKIYWNFKLKKYTNNAEITFFNCGTFNNKVLNA